MPRIVAPIAIVALLLLATLWLIGESPTTPTPRSDPDRSAPADPLPARSAHGDLAPTDAAASGAERVDPGVDAPVYTVRGSVLPDERRRDLTGLRVLAYAGDADDTAGLVAGSLTSMGGRRRQPAFVLDEDPIAETVVDRHGGFELQTRTRHLRVTLDDDFYLQAMPEIVHVPTDTRVANVVLSPLLGGMLRGRLLGERAAEVAEIRLTMRSDPMSILRDPRMLMAAVRASIKPAAKPREDLTFVFRAVPPGSTMTLAVRGGRSSARIAEAPLSPGETRDLVVPVATAATLRVEVADAEGMPIDAASVLVRPRGNDLGTHLQSQSARTDAQGTCTFASIDPGEYTIETTMRGRAPERTEVALTRQNEPHVVRVTLREGGSVTGVVHAPDGTPVAGARVAHHPSESIPLLGDLAASLGPNYLNQVSRSGAETDEHGRFRLTGITDEDEFLVVAAHDDYAPGIARGAHIGDQDVVVTLQPQATVHGVVVAKASGEPIPEFTASLLRTTFLVMKTPIAREAVSDRDGAFRFAGIPIDSYTLDIAADGYGPLQKSVRVPQSGRLDLGRLELDRAASVRGIVHDESGMPIANALVRKRRGAMADNPMLAMLMGSGASTRTDADGRFLLDGLAPGRLQLIANARGFASGRSERLKLAAGQQLDGVAIELGHGGTIRGRLLCGRDQRAEDFVLIVQHQVTQTTAGVDVSTDGTFVASNLDPGAYQVQAMPAGLISSLQQPNWHPGEGLHFGEMVRRLTDNVVSQRCTVQSGEECTVTLDVRDIALGAQWHVRVEVGGKRLDNGIVEAVAVDTGTLRVAMIDDGAATFGRMQAGEHRLQVRTGLSLTPVGGPVTLTFPAGADEHSDTVRLPGGELRGRVVDAVSNEPLHGAVVRLLHDGQSERDDPIGRCLTDVDGAFRFTGLPDGTYSVVAGPPLLTARNTASRRSGITVTSTAAGDPIELRSQPAAGASVLVTSGTGAPIAGATVLCVDERSRPLGSFNMTATGADGRAWFGGLPDGSARVIGRAPGFAPAASELRTLRADEAATFQLALGGGAPTHISIVDAGGRKLKGATLAARFGDGPWLPSMLLVRAIAADGSIDVGRLGPGTWTFRATHPAIGTRTVERTIAGTAPVTIVLGGD